MKTKIVKRTQFFALLCAVTTLMFLSCEKENLEPISEPDAAGKLSYKLEEAANPTADQKDAYKKIKAAMDAAIKEYNKHSNFNKKITVKYVPSVSTANSVTGGALIKFGKNRTYMCKATAMHEISHSIGVGGSRWQKLVDNKKKIYTGENGKKKYKELKGQNAVLKADKKHFWKFGLNKPSDKDYKKHVQMVVAIKKDIDNVK